MHLRLGHRSAIRPPDLTTTDAIRYMLNNAANVGEALSLLNNIDMHSDIGSAHHYATVTYYSHRHFDKPLHFELCK